MINRELAAGELSCPLAASYRRMNMDCKAVLETPAGTLRCMRLRTKFPHVYHSWHREMKSGAVMTIRWEA